MNIQNKSSTDSVKWVRYAAVAAVVIGLLAFSAPLLASAASGGVSLLKLVVLCLVGLGIFQALPLVGQLWETYLLKARKAVARANPIEQMQNDFRRRNAQLSNFRTALTQIYTQIQGMQDMLTARRKAAPNQDLSKQEAAVKKMVIFYESGVRKHDLGRKALEEYNAKIDEKIFEWQFAEAGRKAIASMNAQDQEAILQGILSDEAMRSVQENFNSVFAEIDMEVRSINTQDKLSFGEGLTLDVQAIEIPEFVQR